jgi:hypothetical protein
VKRDLGMMELSILINSIGMIVYSNYSWPASVLLATIFFLIYKNRVDSKLVFWFLCIVICVGISSVVSLLAFIGYFLGGMDNYWLTTVTLIGGAVLWLSLSIIFMKMLVKKFTTSDKHGIPPSQLTRKVL